MNDRDSSVAQALEAVTPTPTPDDRWAAVLREAARRRARRAWAGRGLTVAAAAVVAALLALAWPFAGERGGVLERARAAVGDGPVLHVVLRGEWGGTLVDLDSGRRTPVHAERELWYDAERRLVREVSRFGGVVQDAATYSVTDPERQATELVALLRDYRRALETGSARVAGEGDVDGIPVYWITVRREMLPDVADNRDHAFAHEVAVSRATYEPVALRTTRDGEPGPLTGQRILRLETLPRDAVDFSRTERDEIRRAYKEGREPIPLEEARHVLGHEVLWLGESHGDLRLAQAGKTIRAQGLAER